MDAPTPGLIDLEPTYKQKRSALIVAATLALAFSVVAPFAATPLPHFAAFIPFLNATILVTDLITALLLFAQFSIHRSRALLVLGGGYLFTALIVIPHALTFPGAFSATGLMAAGVQTTAWLYLFWHFGFPFTLFLYAWFKDQECVKTGSIRSSIAWTVLITVGCVLGLVVLTTAGDRFLPRLFLDATHLSAVGAYGPGFDLLICLTALVFLWTRQRSVFDLWLMVVACALIGELALTVIRFSLGFYASRLFSLATSTVVLIILLGETTRLYARLAYSNMMLQRERDHKLMNLEAVVAAISHELKQPLSTIMLRGSTALRFLERTPPNLEGARSAVNQMLSDSQRASEIFNNIRELFRTTKSQRMVIDVNEMTRRALDLVREDLKKHHIAIRTELMSEPRFVAGHKGQLEEVLLNLIYNAIEAMSTIRNAARILHISTSLSNKDAISITIKDTGPGIHPESVSAIFDAFVSTKPQGMGLGLAICRMIIERHGGQLIAWPSQEGGVFQVVLPLPSADEMLESRRIPGEASADDSLLHVR